MSNYVLISDSIATTLRGLMLAKPDPSPRMVAYLVRKVLQLNHRQTIHKTGNDRRRLERNRNRRIRSAERIAA